jgi:hypothetical protein
MKGLFFTELLELIETDYGLAVLDQVIRTAVPVTDGVYTSMGHYDPQEFFGLVSALSVEMNQPRSTFLRSFGRHFFRCLLERNKRVFDKYPSAIRAIQDVNSLVRATRIFSFEEQPPQAEFWAVGPAAWQLTIRSQLPIGEMALGALEACIAYFDEPLEVSQQEVTADSKITTRFDITPKAASCLTTYK